MFRNNASNNVWHNALNDGIASWRKSIAVQIASLHCSDFWNHFWPPLVSILRFLIPFGHSLRFLTPFLTPYFVHSLRFLTPVLTPFLTPYLVHSLRFLTSFLTPYWFTVWDFWPHFWPLIWFTFWDFWPHIWPPIWFTDWDFSPPIWCLVWDFWPPICCPVWDFWPPIWCPVWDFWPYLVCSLRFQTPFVTFYLVDSLRWRWPGEQPALGAMFADPNYRPYIKVPLPCFTFTLRVL
jgi:hypothetical protein